VKVTFCSKRQDHLLSEAASLPRTLESHVNNITLINNSYYIELKSFNQDELCNW